MVTCSSSFPPTPAPRPAPAPGVTPAPSSTSSPVIQPVPGGRSGQGQLDVEVTLPADFPRLAELEEMEADEIDELLVVARFLFARSRAARTIRRVDGVLASALPALPSYAPAPTEATALRAVR